MNKLDETTLREEMKLEASERMRTLHLMPQIIAEFENEGIVEYSERTPLGGALYWIHNDPKWLKIVQEFEEKHNALVYHATHEYTAYGELLSLLFVSPDKDDWEMDRMDLLNDSCFAYVVNLDCPEFSEFGLIGVKEAAGGLIRTW